MEKKDGGTIINWQLHTLSATPERARELGRTVETDKCYVMTGTVKDDPTGRWEPGFHMRSSLIQSIDEENGIIETQNTIYHIEGEQGDVWLDGDIGDAVNAITY